VEGIDFGIIYGFADLSFDIDHIEVGHEYYKLYRNQIICKGIAEYKIS